MSDFIIYIFLFFIGFNSYSKDLVLSVENKKTGEVIESFCVESSELYCAKLEIYYKKENVNPVLIKEYSDFSEENNSNIEAIKDLYKFNADAIKKKMYKPWGALHAACNISKYFSNNHVECIIHTLLSQSLNIALIGAGTTSGHAVLGQVVMLGANGGMLGLTIRPYIVPFAFVADLLRAVTVYPIKKISQGIRKRKLDKKVYPLFEGLTGAGEHSEQNYFNEVKTSHGSFQELKRIFDIPNLEKVKNKRKTKELKIAKGVSCDFAIGSYFTPLSRKIKTGRYYSKMHKSRSQILDLTLIHNYLLNLDYNTLELGANETFSRSNISIMVDALKEKRNWIGTNREEKRHKNYIKMALIRLSLDIKKIYEKFYVGWITSNAKNIPWEKIEKLKQKITVEEVFESYRFIKEHELLCQDGTIKEDSFDIANMILMVHFSNIVHKD